MRKAGSPRRARPAAAAAAVAERVSAASAAVLLGAALLSGTVLGQSAPSAAPEAFALAVEVDPLSPEACAAALEANRAELVGALAPCIVGEADAPVSELCCGALGDAFGHANARIGGCLCHPEILRGVIGEAAAYLPEASELIPAYLAACPAVPFAAVNGTAGQLCSPEQMMPGNEVIVGEVAVVPEEELQAPAAVEAFAILTVEKCAGNIEGDRAALIQALTPCIVSQGSSEACCGALDATFHR